MRRKKDVFAWMKVMLMVPIFMLAVINCTVGAAQHVGPLEVACPQFQSLHSHAPSPVSLRTFPFSTIDHGRKNTGRKNTGQARKRNFSVSSVCSVGSILLEKGSGRKRKGKIFPFSTIDY